VAFRWSWDGKVAVVTGASSGIGARLALDLAERGTTVVGVARRRTELDQVMESCRRAAPASRAIVADLSEPGCAEEVIDRTRREIGGPDLVVNNAAVPMRVHVSRLTVDEVRRAMEINFMVAVRTTLAVLPTMLAAGSGHVVNIASIAGRIGSPRESAYTASKFALTGFTEAAAADLVGTGVRLHLVYPGPIQTEIWTKLAEPAGYHGRFHPPEQVSRAVMACVAGGRFERWVPRWMGILPSVRSAAPRAFLTAAGIFDQRGVRKGAPAADGGRISRRSSGTAAG